MGKKKKAEKKPSQIWTTYKVEGEKAVRKNKPCPKCGAGVFMAEHKNRRTCGKCSFMEKL